MPADLATHKNHTYDGCSVKSSIGAILLEINSVINVLILLFLIYFHSIEVTLAADGEQWASEETGFWQKSMQEKC